MPAALITSPVNNVSTHVRHTELCRVGAVILTIFRHKSTGVGTLAQGHTAGGGGPGSPSPSLLIQPQGQRQPRPLSSNLVPEPGFLHVTLSIWDIPVRTHMALTLIPTLAVQLVLPFVGLPSFPRLPLVS